MKTTAKIDLHLHSNFSDGYFSPEALANKLAAEKVYYASLTDHDSVAGQMRFRKAAEQLGIVTIPGVELFTWHKGTEIHLLAYGIDLNSAELQACFGAPKQAEDVIAIVHKAGGKAFLAHPYLSLSIRENVESTISELADQGLDGIEVYYNSHSAEQQEHLLELADRRELLVSGGSDFHGSDPGLEESPGCEIPRHKWSEFRKAITGFKQGSETELARQMNETKPIFDWGGFYLRIVFPAFAAIALFIGLIFMVVLPTISDSLLERKREMIRELTNSAWSILAEYEAEVQANEMSLAEAQREAAERIRYLRYGKEGKDYFWITDEHPRMIMHPYRTDLNGTDLNNLVDPDGVRLFVEFVNIVEKEDHGYVEYVWQWKDDPERLEAKESYVRGFEPWGWVIGTGIYMEDVNAEIQSITGSIIGISAFNIAAVGALMWFVIMQSLRSERKRSEFERDLRVSQEKYRTIAEAATEGTLVVSGERCTYANKLFLTMLGYSGEELPFLELADLLPEENYESQQQLLNGLEALRADKTSEYSDEIELLKKDGGRLPVLVTAKKASLTTEKVIIISVADIAEHKEIEQELGRSQFKFKTLTENINLGVFRISLNPEGSFIEINSAGRQILTGDDQAYPEEGLRRYFLVEENFNELVSSVKKEKAVRDSIQQIRGADGRITTISLSLVLNTDNQDAELYCDGIMEDISEQRRIENDRERMLAQLQTSLLFLNEPVSNFMNDIATCSLDTPIVRAARMMTDQSLTAIATADSNGEVVGLVTDRDIRERVVAAELENTNPIFKIMTAPVLSVPDNAQVYEAFIMMRQKGVRHLLVKNSDGAAVGIIRINDLVRFDNYSPVVLAREIDSASDVDDLVRSRKRLSPVISSLVSSGVNPDNICRAITSATDAIVEKTIQFGIEKIGPPPARFAFIAMGSEGRGEQTMLSDQDNAIIIEDSDGDIDEPTSQYFLELGSFVSESLASIGYFACPGNIMASNPEMNMTLANWKKAFKKWIKTAEAQELLQFNILFDFRTVSGEPGFAHELRDYIATVLAGEPPFFLHLARNTLLYKPPLSLLGNIVTESSGKSKNRVNIKDAMMPIVNFARLYALKHNIDATNTMDRLDQLRERGELREDNHRELRQSYSYMMQLRIKHQIKLISAGEEPDNLIPIKTLSQIETGMLKRAFEEISLIQKKVSFDYLGKA